MDPYEWRPIASRPSEGPQTPRRISKTSEKSSPSESALREAITNWEQRAKEVYALRFYWLVGVALSAAGLAAYLRRHRWLGTTLLIIGFSEIIYWTTPTFFGGGIQEFDRLVQNKLALSVTSVVILGLVVRLLAVFEEGPKGPVNA
jgi:hypothetical protein